MGVTTYGVGVLYGAADAYYGRISPALAAAQELQTRETGLQFTVTDDDLNQWQLLAGTGPEIRQIDLPANGASKTEVNDYNYYRFSTATIKLSGGNIIRIRAGDGSATNRDIYVQTITDPTNAAQWNSWTLLYSGWNIAVALVATGASTYDVYHSKNDKKLYKNNSLIWDATATVPGTYDGIISIRPVAGKAGAMFIGTVVTSNIDSGRRIQIYYTRNIASVTPTYDPHNYQWFRAGFFGLSLPNDEMVVFRSRVPWGNPRAQARGESLTVDFSKNADAYPSSTGAVGPSQLIRGVGNDWGHNEINSPSVVELSDGYYYLFYTEYHADAVNDMISDDYIPMVWQRSKDLITWSEPVNTGIANVGAGGIFESGGKVYIVGNSEVWSRTNSPTTYDLTNYVPSLNLEIPRDNQSATGAVQVSNPAGINDALLDLSDRRAEVKIGIKTASGVFEFVEFNEWWVRRTIKEVDGAANRLTVELSDIWERLANPLRDTFNLLGKTEWHDWADGKRNKAFNYYFYADANPSQTEDKLVTSGICLYTGWKGHNPRVEALFSGITGNPALIFRFTDPANYSRIEISGGGIHFIEKYADVDTTIATAGQGASSSYKIRLEATWSGYNVYCNDVLKLSSSSADLKVVKPGYVGFDATDYTIRNFNLEDFEVDLKLRDVIKTALAMGDYHTPVIGNAGAKAYAIVWGPQTDLPTAADGLRAALTAGKLQLIWRDGQIHIGRFDDNSALRTIENRIIETTHADEATRRINMAIVDGNEHTWIKVDKPDTQSRDRQIIGYFDLPELLRQDDVKERAAEEIRRGQLGTAPGGRVVLYFDLWPMDAVEWIDNAGNIETVRIEGMSIEIDQGKEPRQSQTLDTSLLPP